MFCKKSAGKKKKKKKRRGRECTWETFSLALELLNGTKINCEPDFRLLLARSAF